jgi:hypothetical protein
VVERHHQPDRVPGFERGSLSILGIGPPLLLTHTSFPELCRTCRWCFQPRANDGSFRNANNQVKEDDPLIATTFALLPLTHLLDSRA